MRRIPYDRLVDFGAALLAGEHVPQANARVVAEACVRAEAFGVTTHGVTVLASAVRQVGRRIDPAAVPRVLRREGAVARIDGSRTFGPLAMEVAKEIAVPAARQYGIAMAAAINTSWLGAIGPYLIDVAEAGLLAQVTTQSSSYRKCAPVGGLDARFSTNPIALALPTGGEPVIADFSTGAQSMQKMSDWHAAGRKAPEPIFLDAEGTLTDDPAVVVEGDGTMLFTGGASFGHKGFALSLWCEALTALSGGHANDPDAHGGQSFTLTVLDPEAFAGREYYLAEMTRFIAYVKASRLRPGFDAIRLPGERGLAALRDAKAHGVPLSPPQIGRLNELARARGIACLPA